MRLTPGQLLGPYEILQPIGAGGMGEVYRARDTRLGREVALKISAERFSERFEREAHSVAAVNHPNVCTLYDVGPNYLVMELIQGPTLAERIKRGPVPLDEVLGIARQIAEAREAAHEQGIIHRDLKPGNVMIRPDGSVKVLDFGIAKIVEAETALDAATTAEALSKGMVLGTPAYMSPEQVKAQPANRTADIWAFGCVLYEMLSGRRAFDGDSVAEILGHVVQTEPNWSALPAETPSEIRKLVERCLRKDSRSRLQNIGDARIEIEDIRIGRPSSEPAASRAATKRRRAWIS